MQREIDQRKTTLEELRDEALTKISDMKTKLLDARDRAVKTRDTAIEEYQKKVQTSRELLRIRQEVLGKQINYNSMRRDIDRRVEKGLEGLSVAIEGIRENLSGDEALEKLSLNPSFTTFVKLEAKKITESQFFKSIKKQIETSNADKEKNLVTADKEEKK